jgi:thymidylate synthase
MGSNDLFLGIRFNVFSYAVLTHLFAARCGLKPKELIVSFGDAHLYSNHVPQVQEQLTRTPFAPPRLIVNERVKDINYAEITLQDFDVTSYSHHAALKGVMSI